LAPFAADIGFSFADPFSLGLLFIGFAIFAAVGALSHQHERAFSASLIYLGLGAGAAAVIHFADIGWLDPAGDAELIDHLTEIAVIIALFSAGLKLDRPLNFRAWSTTARLLLVAMPITIGLVALLGSTLLGLSAAVALLLGACLAPTDPVLAGDIGVGPPGDTDEHEPNFALTSEAGLNDGLAFPFVLLAIFLITEEGSDWLAEWLLADVLYAIAGGVAIGAAVGLAAAWSVKRLRDRELLAPALDGYHAIATVLVIYGLAEIAGTYGFLAAFAGGIAFRRYEHDHEVNASVHEGAELTEKLLELSVILLLGSMLTLTGLRVPGWEGWLLAVLVIVAVRPLSCVIALAGSQLDRPQEKTFVAWFGVRGVGSLFYMAVAVNAGVLTGDERDLIVWTVVACVLLSIVAHGITAGPLMRRMAAPRRAEAARRQSADADATVRRRPSRPQSSPRAR
jgi:NhaP-type Na+/H+ or K+/H+ antiporter